MYSYNDIQNTLTQLGIKKGDTVLVRADLRYLGTYDKGFRQLPQDWYNALASVVGHAEGTIVTPTSNISFCNTDKVFDPATTPSELGVLAEHIRKLPGTIRSFHPFLSYTAIGKNAATICKEVARHGFGPETPKARMIDMGAKLVSIGIPPNYSCTTVHHVEFMMGVPYRYVKEFMQPVTRDGEIKIEPFYLYVWYRECELKKNLNKKTMGSFTGLQEVELGRGKVAAYNLADFYKHCVKMYSQDIYCWLDTPPKTRPYRK